MSLTHAEGKIIPKQKKILLVMVTRHIKCLITLFGGIL